MVGFFVKILVYKLNLTYICKMIINRNIVWTSVKMETPENTRPVTAVVSSMDGAHTIGAYFKNGKWYEQLTKEEVEDIKGVKVLCWADFELPETYLI